MTGAAASALENCDVSPVITSVAVAVTKLPIATPLGRLKLIVPTPSAGVMVVDPRNVWPWPNPEGSATGELKNWIKSGSLELVVIDPWILLPVPPPLAPVRVGMLSAAATKMPAWPFEKMLFERIESPVPDSTETPASTLNAIVLP